MTDVYELYAHSCYTSSDRCSLMYRLPGSTSLLLFWGERKGHLSKNICVCEEKLDAYCILKDIGEGKVDYHKQIRSHFHKTVIS